MLATMFRIATNWLTQVNYPPDNAHRELVRYVFFIYLECSKYFFFLYLFYTRVGLVVTGGCCVHFISPSYLRGGEEEEEEVGFL